MRKIEFIEQLSIKLIYVLLRGPQARERVKEMVTVSERPWWLIKGRE